MNHPLPDERRVHERVSMALAVRYADRSSFLDDWTENVSAGGLFVRSETRRAVGDHVQLEILFPGLLEPVTISGFVSWVRPQSEQQRAGFGLRVESEGHRRKLAELALMATREYAHRDEAPYRVLVVEDNEAVVEMYARVMRRVQRVTQESVKAQFASNGLEACHALNTFKPDLIVTDLYMPVMDGIALCKYVRDNEPHRSTPLMVITAGSDDERKRVEELGIDAFLQKPVQFGQILETIARLLWLRGSQDGQEGRKRVEAES